MRFTLAAAVLLLAVSSSAVLLGVLGSHLASRIDMTATREHQLAPQTVAILSKLERPVRLVLAADLGSIDRSLRQRTLDVLEKFRSAPGAQDRFDVTLIDTTSEGGLSEYDALLRRLTEDSGPAIAKQQAAVETAISTAEQSARDMDALAAAQIAARDALEGTSVTPQTLATLRKYYDAEAAKSRVFAENLRKTAAATRTRLAEPAAPLPAPPLDAIARMVRGPMVELASALNSLNTTLDEIVHAEGMPREPGQKAAEAAQMTATIRDRLARQVAAIDALEPLPIFTVARAIQRSRAALLIAEPREGDPPGTRRLAAIDISALLPPPARVGGGTDGPAIDTRFRTEELIAAGLAAFTNEVRPLVVLVHAAPTRLMPTMGPLAQVAARLGLRGIDFAEWPISLDDQAPAAATTSGKPVVFALLWMTATRPEDADRMAKLSSAARQLVGAGRNMLISVGPSSLPGLGAADPLVDYLPELGLQVDTGLLLMQEARDVGPGGTRRAVFHNQAVIDPASNHPVAGAIAGLRTLLEWPVPMRPAPGDPRAGVTLTPILAVKPDPSIWAESEWMAYWQVRGDPERLPRLPVMDSSRDQAQPATNPKWWVGAAIERSTPSLPARQRVIVIGSPTWLFDVVADEQTVIDGRAVPAWPGNAELLHASLAWLAGRDDMMVRGAQVTALPTVPNLAAGQFAALRLALIGGMPVLVLVLGAVWRLWRG